MAKLIKDRQIADDRWVLIKDASNPAVLSALPWRDVIVPTVFWRSFPDALAQHGGRVGLWLDSHESPASFGTDIHAFPLVALNFPVFSDGRPYTSARELREQLNYQGEIRAIGDVLRDQIHYMHRCGINAFALRPDQDIDGCLQAFADFQFGYQASIDQPIPLFRRRGI